MKAAFRDKFDVVISVTGAQVTNQMFMKKGTKIILLSCSHCLGDTVTEGNSLAKPSMPHCGTMPYFGFDTLYYLMDTPQMFPEDQHESQWTSALGYTGSLEVIVRK